MDSEHSLYTPLKISLLSGLIINFLAVVYLENQRNRHTTLSLTLTPTTPTHTTPAEPTTPNTLPLPPTPKAPQQLPLYHTELEVSPSPMTLSLS